MACKFYVCNVPMCVITPSLFFCSFTHVDVLEILIVAPRYCFFYKNTILNENLLFPSLNSSFSRETVRDVNSSRVYHKNM